MAFEPAATYEEFLEKINLVAAILSEEGLKKGDRASILAENSPAWGIAYLAIVRLGAIVVPILPDFHETDVHHILTDAEVKVLFTTKTQIEKTYELPKRTLKTIITLDDFADEHSPVKVRTFSTYLKQKESLTSKETEKLEKITDKVTGEDIAAIIYTSGTSGHSKAVFMTHENLSSNVESANGLIDIRPDWTFLSILPMSHTYEFTVGFLLPLSNGARIVYAGVRPTPTMLGKICEKEQPSVICMVPLVLEKIYKKRVLAFTEKNKIVNLAIKIPGVREMLYRKIGRKLLAFFGGKLELLAVGGAPMNFEVEKFLRDAALPYLVGYGLTETSPLLSGGPYKDPTIALGSAGKPVPNVEIRIADPDPETGIGEICARGPNIMKGYYKNPELTAETIDPEGWLATGDLGILDSDNNLFIKGRSKSLIVLPSGENIYPEAVEDKLNASIHVVESLVVANNDRLEALIYLDYALIDEETKGKDQRRQKAYIQDLLKKIRKNVNQLLPPYSHLAQVVERQEPFIKTATHKIKRYLYTKQ